MTETPTEPVVDVESVVSPACATAVLSTNSTLAAWYKYRAGVQIAASPLFGMPGCWPGSSALTTAPSGPSVVAPALNLSCASWYDFDWISTLRRAMAIRSWNVRYWT